MIIPIKCFTCGKVIADKYLYFQEEVRNAKQKMGIDENKVEYLTKTNTKKAPVQNNPLPMQRWTKSKAYFLILLIKLKPIMEVGYLHNLQNILPQVVLF